jgi:hypothetical protein
MPQLMKAAINLPGTKNIPSGKKYSHTWRPGLKEFRKELIDRSVQFES